MKIKAITLATLMAVASLQLPAGVTAEDGKSSSFKTADEITKQIVVEGRIAFEEQSLPFKFDSTELAGAGAYRQLVEISKALESPELKDARFMLVGHTCNLGSEAYNLKLSKRRANAIAAALEELGISETRLVVDGLGETEPAFPNNSDSNRAKNRRVELKKL